MGETVTVIGVLQSGLVTPGHAASWTTDGVIQDAGFETPLNFASPPPIGNVEPNLGFFTNLTITGSLTFGGVTYTGFPDLFSSPPPIGNITPNTGFFTALTTESLSAFHGQNLVINLGGDGTTLDIAGGGTGVFALLSAHSSGNIWNFSTTLIESQFNFIEGPTVFSGTYSTSKSPLAISFAASGSPTAVNGVFPYMQWTTAGDVTNVGVANHARMIDIEGNWGGPAMTGGRIIFNVHSNQVAQSGNGANDVFYQAINFTSDAKFNEGGTGLTSQTALGHNHMGGGYARLLSGATNWYANVGFEADILSESGSSVLRQAGWLVTHLSLHAVQGTEDDAAYMVADQNNSVGWTDIFKVGSPLGQDPLDSTHGTILNWVAPYNPGIKLPAAKDGINLQVGAISGNAWASTRHVVKGNGQTFHFNSEIAQTSAGVSLDIPMSVGAYSSIASGGTGNTLSDLYIDNADIPGIWQVTAVGGGGAVTTAALAQGSQPYSVSAPGTLTLTNLNPDRPATFTVNVTWAANKELSLQPGGGVVRVGSGMIAANGSVATVLGSVGPAGSHTTVQEWLTVKNAAGTVRYIPAF